MQKTKTVWRVKEWRPGRLMPVRYYFDTKKAAQEFAESDYRSVDGKVVFDLRKEIDGRMHDVAVYRSAEGAETDEDYYYLSELMKKK